MEFRHSLKVNYKYGQTIKIKVLADIHLKNQYCDERAFIKYLSESDDSTYFLGVGDLLDSIITKDLRYRKSADGTSHETDAVIDEQIERMFSLLEPYRLRIAGLGSGNHEDKIIRDCGTNPIQRLCQMLSDEKHQVPYLGYSWLFPIFMREKNGRGRTVIVRGHHGWGGGSRTQGADLSKYSRDVAYWDADLFLYGHVHRRQYDEIPRLGLKGGKLMAYPKVMVLCGTFLKTYSDTTDPTYSEIAGYPPVSIGGITIHIKPNRSWLGISVES